MEMAREVETTYVAHIHEKLGQKDTARLVVAG